MGIIFLFKHTQICNVTVTSIFIYYLVIAVDGTVTGGIYFLVSVTVRNVTKCIYYVSRALAEFLFIPTALSVTICI